MSKTEYLSIEIYTIQSINRLSCTYLTSKECAFTLYANRLIYFLAFAWCFYTSAHYMLLLCKFLSARLTRCYKIFVWLLLIFLLSLYCSIICSEIISLFSTLQIISISHTNYFFSHYSSKNFKSQTSQYPRHPMLCEMDYTYIIC